MKRLLIAIATIALFAFSARAQQVVFTPTCTGVDDLAKFSSIKTSVGTSVTAKIKLSYGKTCKFTANIILTPNIVVDASEGGLLEVSNGRKLTIQGPVMLPARKVFVNATAGQGEISFDENKTIREVLGEWWGASPSAATSVNFRAFNAANAAITTIGSGTLRLLSGDYVVDATATFPATTLLQVPKGARLSPAAGVTITVNSAIDAGFYQIFTGAGKFKILGTSTPEVKTAWWGEQSVAVPGPTLAPTLTDVALTGTSSFTNSTTYLVSYGYEAWGGPSGISPTTSFTAKNGQVIGVLPKAELTNNSQYAVGAYVYISPDAGSNWYRADGAFTRPALLSFGDDTAGWGGAVITYANGTSGTAPPAPGTTTTSKSGVVISPPTQAPTVVNLAALAPDTYFGAFQYLAEDGTTSPLSPVSTGLVSAGSKFIRFEREEEPPSGAVAVRLFLGTSATPSSLHLQTTVPLHYVTTDIHDYNSSGAAPSTGTAISPVSNIQQAYDAVMDGGTQAKILATTSQLKSPLILRLRNSAGSQVAGIQIEGIGGYGSIFGSVPASGRLYYTGSQTTAVVGVMYSTSDLEWRGLDVRDPNSSLTVGLASCDFFGGGGFESKWYRSTFEAKKPGGIGYQIPIQSSGAGTHTTSEQHFTECNMSGDAWGVDVHGGQTINIKFTNCTTLSNGNSGSANSGQVRNATSSGVLIDGWEGTGAADVGYVFFVTRDAGHPQTSGYGLSVRGAFIDAVVASATSFIHVSGVAVNNGTISISDSLFNSSKADRFAFYSATSASLLVSNVNSSAGGNGWVNWVNTTPIDLVDTAVITQAGNDTFFNLGSTYGFKTSSATTSSTRNNADSVKVYVNNTLLNRTGGTTTTSALITANQNDYNPGGRTYLQRWSTDASRNITGLSFSGLQVDGEQHVIVNVGAQDIVLKHQTTSTASNRFLNSTGADITLTANQSALVEYDGTTARWRVSKRN